METRTGKYYHKAMFVRWKLAKGNVCPYCGKDIADVSFHDEITRTHHMSASCLVKEQKEIAPIIIAS